MEPVAKRSAHDFLREYFWYRDPYPAQSPVLRIFAEQWELYLAECSNMPQGEWRDSSIAARLRETQVIARKARQPNSEWTVVFRPRIQPGYCYVCRHIFEKREAYVRAFVPGEEKEGGNTSVCRDCWDEAVSTPLRRTRRYWSTDKPDALTDRYRPLPRELVY